MRIIRALLAFFFTLAFLAGPVTGAQAAQARGAPCSMHQSEMPDHSPAKTPAHQCKTCIGCAPAPAAAVRLDLVTRPIEEVFAAWPLARPLRTGRSFAPDPTPPRRDL